MAQIRTMVDARYTDTQADIKAIKDHLLKTTGFAPTTIRRDDDDDDDDDDDEFTADDAKKGESGRDRLPKLNPFGTKPGSEPAPPQQPNPNDQSTADTKAVNAEIGR